LALHRVEHFTKDCRGGGHEVGVIGIRHEGTSHRIYNVRAASPAFARTSLLPYFLGVRHDYRKEEDEKETAEWIALPQAHGLRLLTGCAERVAYHEAHLGVQGFDDLEVFLRETEPAERILQSVRVDAIVSFFPAAGTPESR